MNVNSLSSTFLLIAFFVYLAAFLLFVLSITGRKWSNRDPEQHTKRWGFVAFIASLVGFACHVTFFFTRWAEGNHIPTSNMYEFMTFLGMMIMFAFLIVYLIYRTPLAARSGPVMLNINAGALGSFDLLMGCPFSRPNSGKYPFSVSL